MHWYMDVLRKYAVFSGRARRSEYWYFGLFNALVMLVLYMIAAMFAKGSGGNLNNPALTAAMIPYFLYLLAVLIPSLAVGVRRLHDIGKSGWWLFIAFVPVIGGIWLLILDCTDSQPGDNQYGPNPKGMSSVAGAPVSI